MRSCFVPLCDSKNKDQPHRTMFLVPKEPSLFAQWAKVLPKVRALRITDKVCHLHFKPEDVNYTFDHCINGHIYKIKRDRPRLKPNALPCLEMANKDELLSYKEKNKLACSTKSQKVIDNSISEQIHDMIIEENQPENELEIKYDDNLIQQTFTEDDYTIIVNFDENITSHESTNNVIPETQTTAPTLEEPFIEAPTSIQIEINQKVVTTNLFNLFYDNVYEVLVPNTLWGIHRCPDRSVICYSYMDILNLKISKMISINKDGEVQLIFNGIVIKTLHLIQDIDDLDSLSIVLNEVDMWRLCFGKSSNHECEIAVVPTNGSCWKTDENKQVYLCNACFQKIQSK